MSIGKKLLFGFSITTIITVVACFSIFSQLRSIDKYYSGTIERGLPQTHLTADIEYHVLNQGLQLRSYILGNTEALEKLRTSQQELQNIITQLDESFEREELHQLLDHVISNKQEFDALVEKVLEINEKEDVYAAVAVLNKDVVPINEDTLATANKLADLIDVLFDDAKDEAQSKAQNALYLAITLIVATIIAAILTTIFMNRIIALPLRKLQQSVQVIAAGDLTQEDMVIRSKDEVGQLTQSFNTMKDTIRKLITSLSTSAEQLSAAAEELTASTQEVTLTSINVADRAEISAENTQAAAASAKESAIAMDETSSAVQRIAESAQTLHLTASDTSTIADQGESNISSAERQMTTIYESTKLTTELIQKLSVQSMEIENITKVITSITEQTNLLALNAAIEAARAGEHGKGFAVVADEVRKLAEESNASASQITALTTEIQSDTKNVEEAIQQSLATVEAGVGIIQNAGLSFNQIVGAVDSMKAQIEDISAVTEEISAAAEEVAASVSEISSSATTNAEDTLMANSAMQQQVSTLKEISVVSTELSNRAVELQNAVNHFKV
ncbi:HAMP domain-containing methyl-accepting chemotaxis protein [Lysinibacillus sp. 54212]|uniref:HAMP domain-containing methyl-accepting chemotaxis protein n=1 Tax=Lysinibacillus sp. 54212 TaxID=3119829 RepID=UPI002FC91C17